MTHRGKQLGSPPDLSAVMAELIAAGPTVRELVDAYIVATVAACDGNKKRAARRLGISHQTVYTRMNEMELAGRCVAN